MCTVNWTSVSTFFFLKSPIKYRSASTDMWRNTNQDVDTNVPVLCIDLSAYRQLDVILKKLQQITKIKNHIKSEIPIPSNLQSSSMVSDRNPKSVCHGTVDIY